MPDIRMCQTKDCPIKQSCHRFTVNISDHESYFAETPYDEDGEGCEFYWEIEYE
jgi:hypothetical protein